MSQTIAINERKVQEFIWIENPQNHVFIFKWQTEQYLPASMSKLWFININYYINYELKVN